MTTAAPNGDIVVPFHLVDDQTAIRSITVDFVYRFDTVLDPLRLKDSLHRLLQMGNWKKFSARIHRRPDGRHEFRLPRDFTDERPPCGFSHQTFDMDIAEHPKGATIGRNTGKCQTFPAITEYKDLVFAPGTPEVFADWVNTDRPALIVHVVSFRDATLVSLRWQHSLMDAMGQDQLFRAWIAILEGREEDVPELMSLEYDPLDQIPADKTLANTHVMTAFMLGSFQMFFWIITLVWEMVFHGHAELRAVCIPRDPADRLFKKTREEFESVKEKTETFISDSDIVFAWCAKAIVGAVKPSPSRPVMLGNVADLRSRLPEFFPKHQVYGGNASTLVGTPLTVKEVQESSIAQVAARLRASLSEQLTPDQCKAAVATTKTTRDIMWGSSLGLLIVLSNWHKARFFDKDFSAANARGVKGASTRPTFLSATATYNGMPAFSGGGSIFGRDKDGNWWFAFALRKSAWPSVESRLRALE